MLRTSLSFVLSSVLAFASSPASPQKGSVSGDLPAFEVATIRSPSPNADADRRAGFYGDPGGRVFVGGTIRMLTMLAFDLQSDQIQGGRDWTSSQWFEIHAIPPDDSLSRHISVPQAEPTSEQRKMLQVLLRDRFGFKSHFETKKGDVYVLTRGNRPIQMKPPKDSTADPRAIVVVKQGGIADGEAEGINTSTDYLAQRLSRYLRLPVVNQTGITGSYDFSLSADDPENTDLVSAVRSVVERLGLKLKRTHGPIQIMVIDQVQQPSAN